MLSHSGSATQIRPVGQVASVPHSNRIGRSARADRSCLVPVYFNVAFRQVLAFTLLYLTKTPGDAPAGVAGNRNRFRLSWEGEPVRKRFPEFAEGRSRFLTGCGSVAPDVGRLNPDLADSPTCLDVIPSAFDRIRFRRRARWGERRESREFIAGNRA